MRPPRLLQLAAALLVTLALTPTVSVAAPPTTIAAHGVLRSVAGGTVADGNYILSFGLYAADKGGTALWQEGPVIVTVKQGTFSRLLGADKPLTPDLLAKGKAAWLGVTVEKDPELPRVPLAAVPWSLRAAAADSLACTGCISAAQVDFVYAGSKTKGGPAADLDCTGCVSVSELKFDASVDLGGQALKAKKVVTAEVAAGLVSANSFVGDGSKLTGLKTPAGSCPKKGQVVKGIAADGSLLCVDGFDPSSLPPDIVDEISNGLIHNQFISTFSAPAAAPIPDNDPIGVSSEIVVPDAGIAQKLDIIVAIANSDISAVKVQLFDPTNVEHVLYNKGGKGNQLKGTWPGKDKPVSGDLGAWVGKNPKGKWRLKVSDGKFLNNQNDGAITSWSISVQTLSDKAIRIAGDQHVDGYINGGGGKAARFDRGIIINVVGKTPACGPAVLGLMYYDSSAQKLVLCDGKAWKTLAAVAKGSKDNPALSCKAILAADASSPSGKYWLSPKAGLLVELFCDMKTAGGGWIVVNHDQVGKDIPDKSAGDDSKLVVALKYEVDDGLLAALLAATKERRQDFSKKCKGSLINKEYGSQHNSYTVPGGKKIKSTIAFFGGKKTECDINDGNWRSVATTFVNTTNIPILKLWGGDTDAGSESATYKIGALYLR